MIYKFVNIFFNLKIFFKSNPCQHPVIILKEVNIEDLESVLTFMYEGEVSITQLRLHTFMRLAEALQVKGLTESNAQCSSMKNTSQNDNSHNMVSVPLLYLDELYIYLFIYVINFDDYHPFSYISTFLLFLNLLFFIFISLVTGTIP